MGKSAREQSIDALLSLLNEVENDLVDVDHLLRTGRVGEAHNHLQSVISSIQAVQSIIGDRR